MESNNAGSLFPSSPYSSVRLRRKPLPFASYNFSAELLSRIFGYLPSPADLLPCMLTCREWYAILATSENNFLDEEIWGHHARSELPISEFLIAADGRGNREGGKKISFLCSGDDVNSWRAKLRAYRYAWNPTDASKNNFVRDDGFTVHRHPVAQSTDGIRSKIGVSSGVHAWDLTWRGPLGTSAVVGVASIHAAMHSPGYLPLIGSDDQSWGWNLVDNTLLHDGRVLGSYPKRANSLKYRIGERIRMVVDCERRCVYFERGVEGSWGQYTSASSSSPSTSAMITRPEFLGLAFTQLPPIRLFCAVSAVYGNTEVSCVYVGQPTAG